MRPLGGSGRRAVVAAVTAAFVGGLVLVVPATPGAARSDPGGPSGPQVGAAIAHDTSAPVRDLAPDTASSATPKQGGMRRHGASDNQTLTVADPVRQATSATVAAPTAASFEGTNNIDSVVPPDTDGAVGPNHYLELVNTHLQVFNRTGTSLAGPTESAQLWSRFSTSQSAAKLCYTNPGGDGIALYDRGADRWLVSELAFSASGGIPSGPYVECIAVSQTSDPTGAYNVYAFLMSNTDLPDYPKIGIWGNSYYLSANMFSSPLAPSGNPAVWAFDRSGMLAGASPVASVSFVGYVSSTYNTILPADVDGAAQPPAGSPEIFGGLDFTNNTTFGLFQFSQVDWTNPGAATFTGPTNITVAPYNTLCGLSQDCLQQPHTSQLLDAISDRVMYRLAYRNFGDHEALVVDHSVNVSTSATQAGVRWYEFDRALVSGQPSGGFGVAEQGSYAPDTTNNRWMGSVAMDGAGNMAVGYSTASSSTYPSIRFAGRLKADPAGQLTVAEGTMQAGGGSQTGYNRWGDYTRLAVDPVDDCTFWYVGEYYSTSSSFSWQTRIGSFKLSGCPSGPDFSVAATPASQSVVQGGSTPYAVTAMPINNFAGVITWSATGFPSGAQGNFTPSTGNSTTLSVSTTGTTPAGSYPLTVTGTSGGLSHSTGVTLVVTPAGSFTLSASPGSATVTQGAAAPYSVTVTPSGGFNSAVTLSVTSGLPAGASASFTPNPTTSTSSLSVSTGSSTPAGTYTLTVSGTSGPLAAQTTVMLTVNQNTSTPVLHIVKMTMFGQTGSKNWKAWAEITIADQNNTPVSGVVVTFTYSNGVSATRSCTTNTSGYCSTSSKPVTVSLSQQSVTITATNVTKTGYAWDGVKFGGVLMR